MRTAIGLIAGPLRPPKMFDSSGRRVSTSIAIARKVFTKETASAPASSAAFAILAISVTLGLSLGKIGSLVALRTARTTLSVPAALQPKVIPPYLMLAQEMFISIAAMPSASDRMRAISAYSSTLDPHIFTMTTALLSRSSGSFSLINFRTPIPCSPIALSMPLGVSMIRVGGCPSRGSRKRPLTLIPPSVARSTRSEYSTP